MPIITPQDVRDFLRDKALGELPEPQGNLLVESIRFSDDEINKAMELAVDKFNLINPISNYTTENFPNKYLLILGTAAMLMRSDASLQYANQAEVQDGDVSPTGMFSKGGIYEQFGLRLMQEFEQLATGWKVQTNLNSFYGHLPSGYRFLYKSGK